MATAKYDSESIKIGKKNKIIAQIILFIKVLKAFLISFESLAAIALTNS